jgi:two-component system chemotaxis sensor kinase CheA
MITLKALQEGDRILIEIQDDGKGIDPAVIRAKAKSKGIMDAATLDALSDQQVLEIIFMPGFSTADQVSSVSGRGVGMDVVKTNINKMGGEITIDSNPGAGSSIQIRLPLTLAVLPALILKAAGQALALPLASVQEILSLNEHRPQTAGGKPVINLRGEIIRVLDLSELLGWGASQTATVAALVDLGGGRRAALRAEGFIGRDEVMVKPLEGTKPRGVSGVMVDAQGEIVLILDLKELLSSAFGAERAR